LQGIYDFKLIGLLNGSDLYDKPGEVKKTLKEMAEMTNGRCKFVARKA
jgi:hypothetical protein